jgi:hypothetical protein
MYYLIALIALLCLFFIGRFAMHAVFTNAVNNLYTKNDASGMYVNYDKLDALPPPVQRYLRKVAALGMPLIHTARLRHSGDFKTSLHKEWTLIYGEQYYNVTPPGFVWKGTTRLFSTIDCFISGRGGLRVWLLSAFPVKHLSGSATNDAELLRWIGESVLFPTALFPSNTIYWKPIDDTAATLIFKNNNEILKYKVLFNEANEIYRIETKRWYDNKSVENWVGKFSDYSWCKGYIVPSKIEAAWVLDGIEYPYARFTIDVIEYNFCERFGQSKAYAVL